MVKLPTYENQGGIEILVLFSAFFIEPFQFPTAYSKGIRTGLFVDVLENSHKAEWML